MPHPIHALIHPAAPARAALLLGLLAALMASATAAPRLRCEIEQGGTQRTLEFAPTREPYEARPVDVEGRFRFKAVVFGSGQAVDYVKIYSYDQQEHQSVLLHEVKYINPPIAPAGAAPASLTGTHYVYSPQLGREMQYRCSLQEVRP